MGMSTVGKSMLGSLSEMICINSLAQNRGTLGCVSLRILFLFEARGVSLDGYIGNLPFQKVG